MYTQLLSYIGKHPLEGGSSILAIGVTADAKNPDINIVGMRQTGTGLPEKDYYTKTDESTLKVKDAYKTYITTLFTLTGTPEDKTKQQAEAIVALETKIAATHLGRGSVKLSNANCLL